MTKSFTLLAVMVVAATARAQTSAPSATAAATATLSGKVVNSVTGEPLRKAEITLSNNNDSPGFDMAMRMLGGDAPSAAAPPPAAKSFRASTDANGEFKIDRIEPDDYYLTATHAGYADAAYEPDGALARDGKIHITGSDAVKGIVFRLVPHGAVSGRVVDEDGDPVPNAMVTALSGGHAPGKQLLPVDTSPANDRGEFRLGKIPPGTYYLSAGVIHMDFAGAATPPPPADGSPESNYVTTYYPGTTDVTVATKIDVAAGADMTGYTIGLRKSLVVRVKGQALAPDGTPLKGGQVMLMSSANVGSMQMSALHDDGKFELANVQPGSYTLTSVQMNGTQPTMQMQSLIVPKEGISDVKLQSQPEQTVKGKVVIDGDGKLPANGLMVMLMADEGMAGMPAMGTVSDTGTFSLKVSGALYRLAFPAIPKGFYLKSVVWNGRAMLGKSFDFSRGASGEIAVTFGTDGGTMEAFVTASDGKPVSGATVVLVPSDPALRSQETAKSDRADTNGHATLTDIPPGDYLAFAWKKIDADAWLDPDFLKPLEKNGERVKLSAKGNEKVELRSIPAPQ